MYTRGLLTTGNNRVGGETSAGRFWNCVHFI